LISKTRSKPPTTQPLEIELRRDAQIQVHVERVVVCHEGARGGTTGDRLQHRRLDLEEAASSHERPYRRDHGEAGLEDRPDLGIGDQVHVALTVAGLRVRESVVLLGQRTHRLGEEEHLAGRYGQLAPARAQDRTGGADPVAEIEVAGGRVGLITEDVGTAEELEFAGGVPDHEEEDLALIALGDDPAGHADDFGGLGAGLQPRVRLGDVRNQRAALEGVPVGFDGGTAEGGYLGQTDCDCVLGRSGTCTRFVRHGPPLLGDGHDLILDDSATRGRDLDDVTLLRADDRLAHG